MLKDEIRLNNKIHKDRTNFAKKRIRISKEILEKMKSDGVIDDFFYDNGFILILGDCIATMKGFSKSGVFFDHIITDIPYGTVQGLGIDGWKNKGNVPDWDSPIDIKDMLKYCFEVSKPNSNLILFSQEPMTFKINYELAIFQKYSLSNKMIWVKNNHANGFSSKTTPLNYYEEMLLLRKALDASNSVEIRQYFADLLDFIGMKRKDIMAELGQGLDHCFRFTHRTFYVPTEKNYNALIERYKIDQMPGFIPYKELRNRWNKENKTIFNIPEGQKIVKNVFEFKKDTNNIHPTQKPIALLEELVKIFSNKGECVLDFTCGSGSTGIAAKNQGRKFVGIEKDEHFFNEAVKWYKAYYNKSV